MLLYPDSEIFAPKVVNFEIKAGRNVSQIKISSSFSISTRVKIA